MEYHVYRGIEFLLDFTTENLDKNSIYLVDNPQVRKLDGYTANRFTFKDDDKVFFTKRLHSYHEGDVYRRIDGMGIAPGYIGVSEQIFDS